MKREAKITVLLLAVLFLGFSVICWIKPADEYSSSERRKLSQFTKLTWDTVADGKFMTEFEEYNIIVTSLRLDNFVAELANCSRTRASEIISEGRVFVNSINEFKDSKKIEINNIITVRGKGKFIFDDILNTTKKGRYNEEIYLSCRIRNGTNLPN